MSRPKVGAVGVILMAAFIMNIIAIFTDSWIVVSYTYLGHKTSFSAGLVPFRSSEAGWLAATSWMMFLSFALFFVVEALYFHAAWNVHHHGCSHRIRHNFHGIGLLCAVLALLQAIAFILTVCNVTSYYSSFYAKAGSSAGFSCDLALVSAIFSVIAMALAGHVAHYDC